VFGGPLLCAEYNKGRELNRVREPGNRALEEIDFDVFGASPSGGLG